MPVTHEEARQWIQLSHEAALEPTRQAQLSAHLGHCAACRVYAQDIERVDLALTRLGQEQRNRRHVPLSIPLLVNKSNKRKFDSTFLTMRSTVLAVVFAALAFSTWSFFSGSQPSTPGVVPAPTPSGQSTGTKVLFEGCELVLYTVQERDTLASLAQRFSISEEDILTLNDLDDGSLESGQLWLPICNFTPTGTAQGPATLTKTHTPVLSPVTSTPGG